MIRDILVENVDTRLLGEQYAAVGRAQRALEKTVGDCEDANLLEGLLNLLADMLGKYPDDGYVPFMGVNGVSNATGDE